MDTLHLGFDNDFFVPFLVFSIPIIAIVGGITVAVVRSIGQQRIIEMAQRERIAAIERGVDLSKLPPLPNVGNNDDVSSMYLSPHEYSRRRSQNLMIGGVITLFVGIGVMFFLRVVAGNDDAWGVGIVPAAVGIGLLLSSWIVRPRDAEPPRGNS
jgi:hypothetical protein